MRPLAAPVPSTACHLFALCRPLLLHKRAAYTTPGIWRFHFLVFGVVWHVVDEPVEAKGMEAFVMFERYFTCSPPLPPP